MKLTSLPDAKKIQHNFTVGKYYEIKGELGNGYVIINDIGVLSVVLKERFNHAK